MASTGQGQRSRLVGVDVARGVALLGMMAVHVFPATTPDGAPSTAHQIASGRASALFAVLAGVGLALLARRQVPWLRTSVAVRALVVAGLGLLVGLLDSGLAVILVYYGVLFVLALPLLTVGSRGLAGLALAFSVAGPVVSFLVRPALPDPDGANPTAERLLEDPLGLLSTVLVTGYYPVLCWGTYLCAGLAVGRLDLASRAVQLRLALGGALLAAASLLASSLLLGPGGGLTAIARTLPPGTDAAAEVAGNQFGNVPTDSAWWLAVDAPHASTTPDLLHTTGTALLVLGLALLVAPGLGAAARPLAALGAMTLTLYCVHVLVVAATDGDRPGLLWTAQVVAFASAAVLWLRTSQRGPLESVVAAAARR